MKHFGLLRTGVAMQLLAVLILFACKREKIPAKPVASSEQVRQKNSIALNAKSNAAAAHIMASEKLEIPLVVSLPQHLPSGTNRVATYYAVGVQKYKSAAVPGSYPVTYQWVFVAPKADLYDINNKKVGVHGAGPFWSLSLADSIFAQHFVPARTTPSADAESIDWLLLMPKAGTEPTGIFADVDYIQRIATKGGKAPLTPPTSIDETADVKYQAVYRFSKIN